MTASEIRVYWFEQGDSLRAEERIEKAAADLTGRTAAAYDWKLGRSARGKPFFVNHPEVCLSISHSGEYWVCALSEMQVGIDLQVHVRRDGETGTAAGRRFGNMAKRFFHEEEAAYVLEEDMCGRFFRVWAAKESYVKYTGSGIDDDFGCFSVIPEGGTGLPGYASGSGQACWAASGAWFTEAKVRRGTDSQEYTVCVCGERHPDRIIFRPCC